MKVSLNTIKRYTAVDLPLPDLIERINARLGGVEEICDLAVQYKDALVVRVVSAGKHPNADKLTVCYIDDGGVIENVPRNTEGHVQVVCGAPNARAGILAVWLPPESIVPASFSDTKPFVLAARELRGVVSQGMLAAADELALGSDHTGIIELSDDDTPSGTDQLVPGQSFAKVFGLDDVVIDIENKMFTHRPDCFGQLGVAREIAGIQGKRFVSPQWYLKPSDDLPAAPAEVLPLTVTNDASEAVPRFMAVAVADIHVAPSPLWLQCELVRLGGKPINNVVDITNYIMLLTGQPVHAYDYDKLRGNTLGVRMGRKGEQLPLLNGKTYAVTPDDIVIIDGEGPVGMGGVMGGGNSEVSAATQNIVLECANFDMYAVRKTSMRHGLFTDAVTRFNKGQSPLQTGRVLAQLVQEILTYAGGRQAGKVHDLMNDTVKHMQTRDQYAGPVALTPQFVRDRLGIDLQGRDMRQLLSNVEFTSSEQDGRTADEADDSQKAWHADVPFWRTDIHEPEDIVEEIGRLYGFDKLPRDLPVRMITPAPSNTRLQMKQKITRFLSEAGANEVKTYSFVHEKVLIKAEQDASQAFRLVNAISPDLQYYRLSVLPSLLDKLHANIKAGHGEFTLFELGKGHNKKYHADDDQGLPKELEFVDVVYTAKKPRQGAAYYRVRRLLDHMAQRLGLELVYEPVAEPLDYPVTAPFDQTRSAMVRTSGGVFIGMIGELKPAVLKNFKAPSYTAAMTLDFDGIFQAAADAGNHYAPLSRYPVLSQDISLKVPGDLSYAALFGSVQTGLDGAAPKTMIRLSPIGIYQPEDRPKTRTSKTITLHVEAISYDRTLTDEEVSGYLDAAAQAAHEQCGAVRI